MEQGNSTFFTVEFFDVNGMLAVPVLPTMNIVYTNTAAATQTDVVTLTPSNNFFTGTWSSTSAALGLAVWTAIAATVQTATGQIRVLQRKGSS